VDTIAVSDTSKMGETEKIAEIRAKGGTSMTSALICAALLIILQFIS
jgi:hypothetical protein